MKTMDILTLEVRDDMDFVDTASFSDTYDGVIKISMTARLPMWFDKIEFIKIIFRGYVIWSGAPTTEFIHIPYPKVEGEFPLQVISFCSSCARKTMEQQMAGIVR